MLHPNVKILLLGITLVVNMGCGEANAMGKRRSEPAPEVTQVPREETPPAPPVPLPLPPPSSDRYLQGLDLGTKNGERMVEQIKRSTIGVHGCEAQPALEKALVAVSKAIRPPKPGSDEDLDIARGYFKGYSSVIRKALHSARADCELPTVLDGNLPGTIVGSLLCGAGSIDVKLLDIVEIEPLYTGWSGGVNESKTECLKVAVSIAEGCKIGNEEDRELVEKILNDQIALGCAD